MIYYIDSDNNIEEIEEDECECLYDDEMNLVEKCEFCNET
jgi:hypothetical protein